MKDNERRRYDINYAAIRKEIKKKGITAKKLT